MANYNNNGILNLNKTPLKYIVTKNPSVINNNNPLTNGGPLIIYEPSNDNSIENADEQYRELWISKYFLSSGYGAKTRAEQGKLSYIANNYDTNYSYLSNLINNSLNYSYTLFNQLNTNKITKGTEETEGDDISYNVFNFGNEDIKLKELYDKIQEIHILYKLEIYDIQYFVKFKNYSNWFSNFSIVPTGGEVEKIKIIITGNTRDSGGLEDIQINLYNQKNNQIYTFLLSELSEYVSIPNESGIDFTLEFTKTFGSYDNYKFTIGENDDDNKNYIINNIIITTKQSIDSTLIKPISSEILTNMINKYPSYFYAGSSILIFKGLSRFKMINNYINKLINDEFELDIYENEDVNHISLLLNSNLRLIKAEYQDSMTCQNHDIIDFILTKYHYQISSNEYDVEYSINITENDNYDYVYNGNPSFLHKKNNNLYLNPGKIKFTFITSDSFNEITLKNTSNYWISYNNNDNIPL